VGDTPIKKPPPVRWLSLGIVQLRPCQIRCEPSADCDESGISGSYEIYPVNLCRLTQHLR